MSAQPYKPVKCRTCGDLNAWSYICKDFRDFLLERRKKVKQ